MQKLVQKWKTAWEVFGHSSRTEKCSALAFLCLCVFFFECSLTGGGHYLTVGPLTPRMILGFSALVFAVPGFIRDLRLHLRNPLLWMFAAFLAYIAVCGIRGYLAQNRMNVLMADLKGFAWLFLVPVLVSVVRSRKRFDTILSSILIGAVTQALLVLVINVICSFVDEGIGLLHQNALKIQLGMVNTVSNRIYRIFMSSCPYLVVGCAIAVFRQILRKKMQLRYVLSIALCLCAVLLTFTRSVYGCAFVVAGCTLVGVAVICRKDLLRPLRFLAITAAVTAGMIFTLEFTFNASYLNFALSRTLGIQPTESIAVVLRSELTKLGPAVPSFEDTLQIDPTEAVTDGDSELTDMEQDKQQELERQENYLHLTQASDELRAVTQRDLWELIRRNPVFGNGLGAHAPSRTDGFDEYFYLDMLARTGVVGLLLYLLPFCYIVYDCLKRRKQLIESPEAIGALCGMVGFWVITWFNPWMNAVLGIAMYALTSTVPCVIRDGKHAEGQS